ncbi:3-deoxy-manno-octulosonate cytidylyltransferase [Puniceicoccales bacterium CK1056]|uniref:3-deoxy-manno-octulosonate cytidylyltransferase n=1 Tax=Oceanipulchritudo coccoides TaxID=2706888 RepID=A0A6B2M3I2_9BACT|nr:3-deoxy-manno-octulosonate cytidylyltransferase [Oceanipulchritudo coccoides]NDV62769.1 3-deoxy-manno-octulosonate cytidylyltransferase [Oceanipulchritudo coccoides]
MLDCAIVVPARLGSQRFPRKLLQEVHGKPLILWTADNLLRIAPDVPLFFAVAEDELASALEKAGHSCIMTDPDLPSGTDRIAIANREVNARQVVNVQADEPILAAEHISQLLAVLRSGPDVATLATPFDRAADFADPNKVKAVVAENGQALYFSRAPIPYDRDVKGGLPPQAYWHLGLYAYSAEVLEKFLAWKASPLEQTEKLEQLRILENGGRIGVGITASRTIGVDVPEDLVQLEEFLAKQQ